jgi:peptide/nickel transport system substrate-binding protein
MQFRRFKLRLRRRFRRSQSQVADIGAYTEAGLDRHFFRRLGNLSKVWRFIAAWLLLLVILIGGTIIQTVRLSHYYQTQQPMAGGIYSEGMYGSFTNANPMYATSEVDTAVSHLVFAGLLKYDDNNQLTGDLARSWQVDTAGSLYTVHLRPNLTWQDGSHLTADDVVFTFQALQNPDAQSPLAGSWQGITVAKKDAYTVTFHLTNPLAAFPYSLTTGIVPAKAFKNQSPTSWRSLDFNSLHPVGAGPFRWDALQVKGAREDKQVLIAMKPFEAYALGKPKLSSFVVHTFSNDKTLIDTFERKQLTAMVPPATYTTNDKAVQQRDFVLTAAEMVFFNNNAPVLSDSQVRRTLTQATDVVGVERLLGYPTRPVREPLLKGQVGYDPTVQQVGYDLKAARAGLDKAGWLVGKNGSRFKDGKALSITLVVNGSSREQKKIASKLQADWRKVGAVVAIPEENTQDFQNALSNHAYDAVLYGISIGVDPDVFVYWHSSQTDPRSSRLNISLYKSATADAALEAGRTRLDPLLRAVKYKPFLQAWQQDAPAVGLFQPRYRYLTHQDVYGLNAHVLNNGTDRLNNVQDWMILTSQVTNK